MIHGFGKSKDFANQRAHMKAMYGGGYKNSGIHYMPHAGPGSIELRAPGPLPRESEYQRQFMGAMYPFGGSAIDRATRLTLDAVHVGQKPSQVYYDSMRQQINYVKNPRTFTTGMADSEMIEKAPT